MTITHFLAFYLTFSIVLLCIYIFPRTHSRYTMKEKDIVDIDQESSIKYKDKTMFNSVQTGKSKDVLVNTDIPSRPAS